MKGICLFVCLLVYLLFYLLFIYPFSKSFHSFVYSFVSYHLFLSLTFLLLSYFQWRFPCQCYWWSWYVTSHDRITERLFQVDEPTYHSNTQLAFISFLAPCQHFITCYICILLVCSIVETLVEHGAQVNYSNTSGKTR